MKTYIVHVHDEDTEYIEELLRAATVGCKCKPTIEESRPLPKRRRKAKPAEGGGES